MAPLPPPDLAQRAPAFAILPRGKELHRFFTADLSPIYFNRSDKGRFNDTAGRYGVLYAAAELQGAFAETFLREPGRTLLASDFIARKGYVRLVMTRRLKLIRFAGPGLARLGATAEIAHAGPPYGAPQTWSTALHAHSVKADGIAYYARHDDEAMCYAIFDRASAGIREVSRDLDIDTDWFWKIAEMYNVGLAP